MGAAHEHGTRRATAVGAEVGSERERSSALAPVDGSPADGRCPRERGVDLMDSRFEDEYFAALLEEEVLTEAVPARHLEREAAEVANPILAHACERSPFAAESTRCRRDRLWRRAVRGLHARHRGRAVPAAEAVESSPHPAVESSYADGGEAARRPMPSR